MRVPGSLLSTSDTVACETPQAAAMSDIVGFLITRTPCKTDYPLSTKFYERKSGEGLLDNNFSYNQ
jgi:hypothetical protein